MHRQLLQAGIELGTSALAAAEESLYFTGIDSFYYEQERPVASQEFAMEYPGEASVRLDTLPFTREAEGKKRPATREEMASFFRGVAEQNMNAKFFSENDTLQSYGRYIEDHFKIIPSEWNKIATINETEGGVEGYFANCRTTSELVDKLLIPTVKEGLSSENAQEGNGFAVLFGSQREQSQQENIEQELFANSLQQNPTEQQRLWQREQQTLQKRREEYTKTIAFYTDEGKKAQQNVNTGEAEFADLQKQLHASDLQQHSFDQKAAELLQELKKWPQTANIASSTLELYQRSEFFMQQLDDDIAGLEARYKDFDAQRRQAYRWLDIYGELDAFAADPVLLKKIDAWSGDFYYLKSGAELFRSAYDQTTPDKQRELFEHYPFWAAAVVTTSDEVEKLMSRLQKSADEFFAPVFVLTEREVRALLNGEEIQTNGRQVVPAYWQNIMPDSFADWLASLRMAAKQADTKLQENDHDLNFLRSLFVNLKQFFAKHPFQAYQENARQLRTLQAQISLQEAIDKAQKKLQALQKELRQLEKFEQELLRKNECMGFNADDVQAALVENLTEQITYETLRAMTLPILAQAENSLQAVATCRRKSEKQEEAFRDGAEEQ